MVLGALIFLIICIFLFIHANKDKEKSDVGELGCIALIVVLSLIGAAISGLIF